MTTVKAHSGPARRKKHRARHAFDPLGVKYSLRWLGMLAGGGLLATRLVRHGGRGGLAAVGTAGVAGLASLLYATRVEPRRPTLERVTLSFPGLPAALDGLRVGVVGDMHLGHRYCAENTAWGVAQMVAEAPDLVAITGDLVSYRRCIADLPRLLGPLRAPLGVYAVFGNHDYWEGTEAIRAALEPTGITFLVNAHRALRVGGEQLVLAGVDDMWEGDPDLGAALAGAPPGAFTMLLAHAPDFADEAAAHRVDLQLSGHTHGGHLRLPLLGPFALPFYGTRYTIGHERVGPTQVYISRGLAGKPLRLLCPPEATVITLRRG